MDHFQYIYASQAASYHRMIAAEDADNNLLASLQSITSLAGKRILDLGSGTGRLPLLVSGMAGQVVALDLARAMLLENRAQRRRAGLMWEIVQGDMRALPIPDGWSQVTLAGWAIGHLRGWFAGNWQTQIRQVLQEMQRVTAPEGAVIILETLGTGSLEPAPPSQELADYYAWLEAQFGFARREIRTDYQFESVEQAVMATEFFFGPQLAAQIRTQSWARLPEWTGVWSKDV